jgi:hypothetical protein
MRRRQATAWVVLVALVLLPAGADAKPRKPHPPHPHATPTLAPTMSPLVSPRPSFKAPSSAPTCTTTVGAGGDIQAAISAAGSGALVCLTQGATYNMSSALQISSKTNFTLDLNGAFIQATTYYAGIAEMIYVSGGSNITVRDRLASGGIIGNYAGQGYPPPDGEFQAGVAFAGTQGGLVEGLHISFTQGDGVGIYGSGGTPSRNIIVRDNVIVNAGRWGIVATFAEHLTWIRNDISDTQIMFELEGDLTSEWIDDVLIQDNTGHGWAQNLVGTYGPASLSNITVDDNHVTGTENRGIWSHFEPTSTATLTNIDFTNNTGTQPFWEDPCVPSCKAVVRFTNGSGITVTGNSQPVTPASGMAGALTIGCTGVSVSGNTFTNATTEWEDRP